MLTGGTRACTARGPLRPTFPARRSGLFDRAARRAPTSDAPSPLSRPAGRFHAAGETRRNRDRCRRHPGERASDFHDPERLSSEERPVKALCATRWRASITPRAGVVSSLAVSRAGLGRFLPAQPQPSKGSTTRHRSSILATIRRTGTPRTPSPRTQPKLFTRLRSPTLGAPAASGTAHALSSVGGVPRHACRTGRWLPTQLARCGAEANSDAIWTSITSPVSDNGTLERSAATGFRPRLALGSPARTEAVLVQTGMPSTI